MSGGFFRGTSSLQDTRFSNKHKQLLKSQKFAAELDEPVDVSRVKMDVIKPWIYQRVTELLGIEDDVLINYVFGLLEPVDTKILNGKEIQISLTGFMEKNTGKFMKELWTMLLSAQQNVSGIPQQMLDQKALSFQAKKAEDDRIKDILMRGDVGVGQNVDAARAKAMEAAAAAAKLVAAKISSGLVQSQAPPQQQQGAVPAAPPAGSPPPAPVLPPPPPGGPKALKEAEEARSGSPRRGGESSDSGSRGLRRPQRSGDRSPSVSPRSGGGSPAGVPRRRPPSPPARRPAPPSPPGRRNRSPSGSLSGSPPRRRPPSPPPPRPRRSSPPRRPRSPSYSPAPPRRRSPSYSPPRRGRRSPSGSPPRGRRRSPPPGYRDPYGYRGRRSPPRDFRGGRFSDRDRDYQRGGRFDGRGGGPDDRGFRREYGDSRPPPRHMQDRDRGRDRPSERGLDERARGLDRDRDRGRGLEPERLRNRDGRERGRDERLNQDLDSRRAPPPPPGELSRSLAGRKRSLSPAEPPRGPARSSDEPVGKRGRLPGSPVRSRHDSEDSDSMPDEGEGGRGRRLPPPPPPPPRRGPTADEDLLGKGAEPPRMSGKVVAQGVGEKALDGKGGYNSSDSERNTVRDAARKDIPLKGLQKGAEVLKKGDDDDDDKEDSMGRPDDGSGGEDSGSDQKGSGRKRKETKEERRERKEEKRKRKEERRKRKEEKRVSKEARHGPKSANGDTSPDHRGGVKETEEEAHKRLEEELRKKALDSLLAKKASR